MSGSEDVVDAIGEVNGTLTGILDVLQEIRDLLQETTSHGVYGTKDICEKLDEIITGQS